MFQNQPKGRTLRYLLVVLIGNLLFLCYYGTVEITRYPAPKEDCGGKSGLKTTTESHAQRLCSEGGGGANLDNVMLCDQERNPIYKHDVETLVGAPVNRNVFLSIGVPSISRRTNSSRAFYLNSTLTSLLTYLHPEDVNDVIIVVYLADFEERSRAKIRQHLQTNFQSFINSGRLRVIEARASFYPPLSGLPRTFGDSSDRVFWRSKQVMDYVFLMRYCENLSRYYLQQEDDVFTEPNYTRVIRQFIQSRQARWSWLEFCSSGFIAKLFRTEDLDLFARFFSLYYNDMPCDVLLWNSPPVKYKQPGLQILYRPDIFHLIGKQSSRLTYIKN